MYITLLRVHAMVICRHATKVFDECTTKLSEKHIHFLHFLPLPHLFNFNSIVIVQL